MSESISSLVLSDIQAACSTLGGWDEGKYYKEPDCIESLKDLLRYLRRDDESHEIRRILGRIQVLKTDLLPLLKFYPDDDSLFDVIIRLLVDLMNPAILLYKEELPVEKFARNNYLEIVSHLQSYKLAFTDSKVWIAITKKLESLLHKNWETRQEEDKDMIERILVLVRNILHVPANPSEEKRTDDDVNVHDQVLWAMHLAHMEDLLLYVTSSDDETDYCFHCLEILSLMLREQSPEMLARAEQPRTAAEKDEDIRQLLKAREAELARKKIQMQARTNRHPRFGGTFTVKNMKGIGDSDLVAHDTLSKLSQMSFDRSKPFKPKPKNRRPVLEANDVMRRSTLNIRLFLKRLCTDFLKWCYNPMMRTVKSFLQRKKALSHDEGYYFWALKFFMEFNRHNGFDVSLVSETICKEAFHYVQTQLEQYYEMMVTDKGKIRIWSKRLHVGLKAYQELLRTLAAMDSSPEEAVREAAKVLKGTIFYLPEYREIVLHLLLNFNEVVQPISYLRDLVEMVHVYVKMLQHFAKGHRHIIVKQKAKARRKSKKKKPKENTPSNAVSEEVQQQEWLEVSSEISMALQGEEELPDDIVPYDSTLDNTENEQKLDALSRIHAALKARETAKAVALLRAGQELWPGQDMFGSQEDGTEFQALKEIFFANMAGVAPEAPAAEETQPDEGNEEEEEEQDGYHSDREQVLQFDDFIKRFANPKVVIAYCKLLSHYRTNSPATNQHVLRMLHRLAVDLKMYPMLFQASVFKTFQRIMHDCYSHPKDRVDATLKELARLATFVVRNFVATAQENKIAFAELLFWKTTKDAYELVHGYGTGSKKLSKIMWTDEQVYELKVLYERYKDEATPDKDVVDLILEHMIDDTRTRRSVLMQLKKLGLIESVKGFTKKAKANAPWTGEDVIELRELFEKYRESTDIMGQILEHLTVKRPRHRVVDKILEIGLVCNRKELRKKQARKDGRAVGSGRQRRGSDDSGSSSADDDDDDERIYGLFKSGEEPVRPAQLKKNAGRAPKNAQSRPPKGAPTFRTVPRTEVATSPEELRTVLSNLVEAGCQESLEWLLSSLEDALEDWDPEDPTSVPLVPILEAHHSSMENSDFCSLLRTMGIQPPADEQEAYWRIPADMTTTMLNSRVTVVKRALEGDYGASLLVVGPASNDAVPELDSTDSDSDGPSPHVVDEDHEASATSERIPKNKLKHRKALQALLQKKRARQEELSDTDSDEVGFARRNQRTRKRPRTRDTGENEEEIRNAAEMVEHRSDSGISGGELPASPPASTTLSNAGAGRTTPPLTTSEPAKKRKRATLVVDSDEERESSKRAELVDVDEDEDVGPVVLADDESPAAASAAGRSGAAARRAGKGGRLVVLDDSDEDDVVDLPGAVADRGATVANGDGDLNRASGPVIDLGDQSDAELSDRGRRKSSASPTRADSLSGSRETAPESRKGLSTVVEDGSSGSDAEILEDAPIGPAVNKPAKARRAVLISSDEED